MGIRSRKRVAPERLKELHKLDKAHDAVGDHEVLETTEAAFSPPMPTSAVPCPEDRKAENTELIPKGCGGKK